MTKNAGPGKPGEDDYTYGKSSRSQGIWAPLSNISLLANAVERSMNRAPNLPGIVVMNGPSGFGKTMAATYCQNKFDGLCVECRSFFTAKNLMAALLREAGIVAAHRLADMHDQLIQELRLSRKPIFIDEVDHIAETKALQIIRDIHDAAQCAVILIGEENLPKKLVRTERFHNRVLVWQPASAASERDAHQLARFYSPVVEIEDDLVKLLHKESKSVVRRICVNIDAVREYAHTQGLKKIGIEQWGNRPFYSDQPPSRRPA